MVREDKDSFLQALVLGNGWFIIVMKSFCIMDSLTSEVGLN